LITQVPHGERAASTSPVCERSDMTRFLFRLGRSTARHPFRTIGLWLLVAVAALQLQGSIGGEASDRFTIPGAESQHADDLLGERFPSESHAAGQIVFNTSEGSLTDGANVAAIAATLRDLADVDHVADVSDPFDARGPTLSPDGRTAFATVTLDEDAIDATTLADIDNAAEHARERGLTVELASSLTQFEGDDAGGSEMQGMAVAAVVLLLAFGSVIAMGIPIGTAVVGIFIGAAGIGVLMGLTDTPEVASMIGMMIGLGVGIDYALFVVTRHRQHLAEGMAPIDAAGMATATAGQAVVFAGSTVVIAILGLQLAGLPAVAAVGVACAIVVTFSVLVAISLLPAFLGLAGTKIDRLRVPGIKHRTDHHATASGRWADHVGRHPWRYALASFAVLAALAAPTAAMRMAFADDSNVAADQTERRAHDLLADGFGAGYNGPLLIAIDVAAGDATTIDAARSTLEDTPGIASVEETITNEAGDLALITAYPTTSPQDGATSTLVRQLRDALPDAAYVGGNTAATIDLSDRVAERLPVFIGAVLLLSFLLLVVMFRSILVPLKAALMNLLSIGAAYGVIVAVFQWGWAKELVGIDATMPVNPLVPLIMFAILFGLSMDYEVFLLSRVREQFLRHGDSHRAVVEGLGSTARVITSAALIMMSVFGAFIFQADPIAKMFGLGLATAVLIDATLVRMVLVPATMSLLGDRNWWLPAWLDRILPNVDIESGATIVEQQPDVHDDADDDERELVAA
jgi:RND superfamily putative drug exporter